MIGSNDGVPGTGHDTIPVGIAGHGYDIVIGERLLQAAGWMLRPLLPRPRVVVVTDRNVAGHHLGPLEAALREADIRATSVILPPGEGTKDFAHLERLVDNILECGIDRSTTLIALGGGVVGDITGFAAAILLRGIPFVQIPTTLLAQVDSSVGGKTGINGRLGKNLIGAFHQPLGVLIDIETLDTLPRREVLAGYAEIAKYALLADAEFFDWLNLNGSQVRDGGRRARRHAIRVAVQGKADIVAEDEKETGRRALLNLGHTFGHALEAQCGYGDRLLHGEAVAIGMVMACELSARLGYSPAGLAERVRHHLAARGLPAGLERLVDPGWTAEALVAHMRRDKKIRDGRLTFVLPSGAQPGQAFVARDVAEEDVRAVLDAQLERARAAGGS